MDFPLYLQGPPAASQIWSTRFFLNFASFAGSATSALKNVELIFASAATLPNSNRSNNRSDGFFRSRLLYKASFLAATEHGRSTWTGPAGLATEHDWPGAHAFLMLPRAPRERLGALHIMYDLSSKMDEGYSTIR